MSKMEAEQQTNNSPTKPSRLSRKGPSAAYWNPAPVTAHGPSGGSVPSSSVGRLYQCVPQAQGRLFCCTQHPVSAPGMGGGVGKRGGWQRDLTGEEHRPLSM